MRYNVYSDGENKIIVTSTYAGKTVRGIAKCAPNDEFNFAAGQAIATARCDAKIAEKRRQNAQAKYSEAWEQVRAAIDHLSDMESYLNDARAQEVAVKKALHNLLKGM